MTSVNPSIFSIVQGIGEKLQIPPYLLKDITEGFNDKYRYAVLKELKYYDELIGAHIHMDCKDSISIHYIDHTSFDATMGTSLTLYHNPMERYTNNLDEIEMFLMKHDELMSKAYMRAFVFFSYSEIGYRVNQLKIPFQLPNIDQSIRNDEDVKSLYFNLIRNLPNGIIHNIHHTILHTGMSPILYNNFWMNAYAYSNRSNINPFTIPMHGSIGLIGYTLIDAIYDGFTEYNNMETEFGIDLVYDDYKMVTTKTLEE